MVLNHFSHLKVESPCSEVSPSVLPWGVLQLTFSSQERRKPEFEQSLGTYLDLADLKPWLEMWPHTGCILNIYLIHWAVTPFSEGVWETAGFPGSESEPKKCFRQCYCGLCFSVTDMCDGFVAIPIAFRFRRKVLLRLTSGRLVCPVHNMLNWIHYPNWSCHCWRADAGRSAGDGFRWLCRSKAEAAIKLHHSNWMTHAPSQYGFE